MTGGVTDDDEALAALVNMTVVLADNKYALGRRLAEWAVGPPTLEGSVAGAAIGQQLLGQARVLYPVVEELSGASLGQPDAEGGRSRHYSLRADDAWPTWAHAVSSLFLANDACNVVLAALRSSAHENLAKRTGRMLEDERFQAQYSAGRVRELVARYEPGRSLLQERVDESFVEVLCWFGPSAEPGVAAMERAGLVEGDNDRWRQQWLDRVAPVLDEVGIRFPAHRNATGQWEWGELPWDRWNRLQRRLETPSPSPTANA